MAYDLRPLLIDLRLRAGTDSLGIAAPPSPSPSPSDVVEGVCIWMRLRHTQDEGSGRAEEVVAALAEALPGLRGGQFQRTGGRIDGRRDRFIRFERGCG